MTAHTLQNLFKDSKTFDSYSDYYEHIEQSLKSLGFSKLADDRFFELKLNLFYLLYQEALNSGASFDVEIFFNSLIDDLRDTFDEVSPSLLKLQREKGHA